ncbi:hypothetical protein BZG35_16900 [Brevundimonas sp. LM2]|uniref:hypothetical protein n=1 Tax=Brevundimonas sp. LM2 TaxID=1938605 RepID=UPI000983FF46|nr:hypothetical protein [Brevundimonas sp. LM2]AQR63140.1 hypothetical protein BZG35_16900 [Brevundimonas sp. LM2]
MIWLSLTLFLSMQALSIPPALPDDPGPERRAAAQDLFGREPYVSENSYGISIAAARLAGEVLTARDAQAYDRDYRLSERLGERAKVGSEIIIDQAIACLAEPIAQRFTLPELVALKTFISTREGQSFWMYHVRFQPWVECFSEPVRSYLGPYVDQDFEAVIAETPIR